VGTPWLDFKGETRFLYLLHVIDNGQAHMCMCARVYTVCKYVCMCMCIVCVCVCVCVSPMRRCLFPIRSQSNRTVKSHCAVWHSNLAVVHFCKISCSVLLQKYLQFCNSSMIVYSDHGE
jgi:hypothetical protein